MAAVPPIQAAFFATYGFPYDPQLETMDQFRSMSNAQGWQHDSPVRHQALEELRDAIAMQFNLAYGEDVKDLTAWHALFQVLRLTNIPDTVGGCKAAIKGTFVNICDLVDYSVKPNPAPVTLFPSEVALAEYSRDSGKIYKKADATGLLSYLLRYILRSRPVRSAPKGRGRARGRGGRGG